MLIYPTKSDINGIVSKSAGKYGFYDAIRWGLVNVTIKFLDGTFTVHQFIRYLELQNWGVFSGVKPW